MSCAVLQPHSNVHAVQVQDAGNNSDVVNAINVLPRPPICLFPDRGEAVYRRMPLIPDNAPNDIPQGIIVEPLQEQHPAGNEQNRLQDRGNADGRET